MSAAIVSAAHALPVDVVPNAPIARRLGVSEDWIVARTGIHERRVAAAGTRLADLAAAAARRALASAGVAPAAVDLVLVATSSADDQVPNTAPLVAGRLGAHGAAAIDVGAACTGWVSALWLAAGLIDSGRATTAVVIGAEIMSRLLDRDDRRTAALFGDGAGAAVVRAGDRPGAIGPFVLHNDAAGSGAIVIDRCERRVRMEGHHTYTAAVQRLAEVTDEALAAAGRTAAEIDLFVYHQANGRILAAVAERLALPTTRVLDVVGRYGNTSAASIPIALADASAAGRLPDGARVLIAAFGAGFTWGGGVLEWTRP
jgi:3-oxoacyl-[acyl-carrier-protein] synthase-3